MTSTEEISWEQPGTYLAAPGVHRIPLTLPGDGLKAVNVYAVEDGDGIALVDAGSYREGSLAALESGLAPLGWSLRDITVILATHAHYDHYGLANQLRTISGAKVLLGEEEMALMDVALSGEAFTAWMQDRRRWLGQNGAAALLPAIEHFERHEQLESTRDEGHWGLPDQLLADGERIALSGRTLRVQWTPGHSRGHIVYHDDANGILFAGDHVLPHITPSIGFEPLTDGLALDLFLDSLRDIRETPTGLVLPGHGHPFTDLSRRVDELLAHHEARLNGCIAAITRIGTASAAAVADALTWTRHERAFASMDGFNRMLAVTETFAHLELLVRAGQLVVTQSGDQRAYALA